MFLTKLLTLGVLFSKATTAVVIAKLGSISYIVFNRIYCSVK